MIDREAFIDIDPELFELMDPRPVVIAFKSDLFFWYFAGELAREISVTEPFARESALSVKSGSVCPSFILMTMPENGQVCERRDPDKALESPLPFTVRNFQRSSGFSVATIQLWCTSVEISVSREAY